jgi:dihydrofolate synthase/folylpolyglutamate synthase
MFRNADEVYAYLDKFLNFERKLEPKEYRLDRMQSLQELFAYPDGAYRVVHVAGSKGKGSTATMIAAILGESEGPVGLYTSPHLLSYTERIAIGGIPVNDDILLESAAELAQRFDPTTPGDFPGGETPTYFELLTMLGFLCFRRAGCPSAVIEVGLGGRLDSTNVVTPAASVITPIELEHTELLGDTIRKIAGEKAGIIKRGVPSFTSVAKPDALEVIREKARDEGSELAVLDELAEIKNLSIGIDGTRAVVEWKEDRLFKRPMELFTPMIGAVQARNAVLAAMVTRSLGSTEDAIRHGLSKARLRARFEIIPGRPVVILDGAHTEDSIRSCAEDFGRLFPGGGRLIFGCAKGKSPRPMAAALRIRFDEVIVTKPGTFKESDPAEIASAFIDEGFKVTRIDDTANAIRTALSTAEANGEPLLVTGSFYLCGAVAAIIA